MFICVNNLWLFIHIFEFFFFEIVLTIPCGTKYSWLGKKKIDATC